MSTQKFIQSPPSQLAGGGVTATATTIILETLVDIYGNRITSSNLGSLNYGTIEPGIDEKREIISFTGITNNANGTDTLTGVTRNLAAVSPYTQISATGRTHSGGSTFILTNNPQVLDKFLSSENDETITGTYTFTSTSQPKYDTHPTFTLDEAIIDKKYADDLAITGSPDMSTTVKGIAEEATEAEINADTGAGGTSARLAVNPSTLATSKYGVQLPSSDQKDALAGTSGTPDSSNKYVTNDDVSDVAVSGKVVRASGTALPALDGSSITGIATANITGALTDNSDADSLHTHDSIGIQFVNTVLLDDNTLATSYTDIDASATVGSNTAMLMLKIESDAADGGFRMSVRPNGDANDYSDGNAVGAGASGGDVDSNNAMILFVKTDSSGIFEYKASTANDGIITLIAYWK